MKRFLALFSIVVLMFTLAACDMSIATTYSATFTFLGTQDLLNPPHFGGVVISNHGAIMKTRSILKQIIEETDSCLTFEQLREMISIEYDQDTQVYTVCITAEEEQMAMDLAQAMVRIIPAELEKVTGSRYLVLLDPPKLTKNGPLKNLFS